MDDQSRNFMKNLMLMNAIEQKNHQEVEALLGRGANPNFLNSLTLNGNCTPLHVAVAVHDLESVKILLKWGAKWDTKNGEGVSAWDRVPLEIRNAFNKNGVQKRQTEEEKCGQLVKLSKDTYFRRPGTTGILGQLYESKMLSLLLWRLMHGYKKQELSSFRVETNSDRFGKFDDIVLHFAVSNIPQIKHICFQLKHREDPENNIITFDQLNEIKYNKKNPFSLHTNFKNYLNLMKTLNQGSSESLFGKELKEGDFELVVFTTASSDYVSKKQNNCNPLLKTTKDGKVLEFGLDEALRNSLITNADEELLREIGVEQKGIEGLVDDFLSKFKIYCCQPLQHEIENIVQESIGGENPQLTYLLYHDRVQEYLLKKGETAYLTESCTFLEEAEQVVHDRRLLTHVTSIFNKMATCYNLEYNEDAVNYLNLEQFLAGSDSFCINFYSKSSILSLAKLSQYFNTKFSDSFALIYYGHVNHEFGKVFYEFLTLSKFKYMIIYCEKSNQCQELQQLLIDLCINRSGKKIVTVSDQSFDKLQGVVNVHDTRNSLADLTAECQEEFLASKIVSFQNREIKLGELMGSIGEEDYIPRELITDEIIMKILDETVCEFAQLPTEPIQYFIDRKFNSFGRNDQVPIQTIESFNSREILLVADPGMGKSTLLTQLSRNFVLDWIIRFNLLDFTNKLDEMTTKSIDLNVAINFLLDIQKISNASIEIERDKDLFEFKEQTKCDDLKRFELKIFEKFYNLNRISVFVDGFDEIAPDYVKIVLELLNVLKGSKIRKLFVTSRDTKFKNELENQLGVLAHSLLPFTEQDVRDFFKKFWKSNINIRKLNETRVEEFTSELFRQYYATFGAKISDFLSVPLHLEMIARCVQGPFEEYHRNGCVDYKTKLKDKLNIIELYTNFFQFKCRDVYLKQKNGIDLTKIINRDKEKKLCELHERLALCAMFDLELLEILAPEIVSKLREDLKNVEKCQKCGFVTQIVDERPQFRHFTYAEFLAAQFIWKSFCSKPFNQLKSIIERIFIGNLIANDRIQICQFIQAFALQGSYNIFESTEKACFLIKLLKFQKRTTSGDLLLSLVECCTITINSDVSQSICSLPVEDKSSLLNVSAEMDYAKLHQTVNQWFILNSQEQQSCVS